MSQQKILQYLKNKGESSAKEIREYLGISETAFFQHIKKLLEIGEIKKIGSTPKVYYSLNENIDKEKDDFDISDDLREVINRAYLYVTASGEFLEGFSGFLAWCKKTNQKVEKAAKDYVQTLKRHEKYFKNGVIDGMYKFKKSFSKVYLDKVFYLGFYSIERFGKTKLGQMLLYAKQSQDLNLIKKLSQDIKPRFENIIKRHKVDAVAFIPPTVKRQVQFIKELERDLALPLQKIRLEKIKTPVLVPQKTLNKLEDRIENAQETIFIKGDDMRFKTLLLIDDAVGSGATLNEIAKKIKNRYGKVKVIGLSIVGSFKGFEIISEV